MIYLKEYNSFEKISWKDAIISNDLKRINRWIEDGDDVNTIIVAEYTSIFGFAISNNNFKIASYLLSKGADINLAIDGLTSLITAAIYSNVRQMKFLIDNGADWDITDNNGKDFLDHLPEHILRSREAKTEIMKSYPDKYKAKEFNI